MVDKKCCETEKVEVIGRLEKLKIIKFKKQTTGFKCGHDSYHEVIYTNVYRKQVMTSLSVTERREATRATWSTEEGTGVKSICMSPSLSS
ncbi:hypothetical protein JOB18_037945 [Solea senegalensis]|uniref:Uncharacterized protein n=1 Tax=Solea senegalensis TaxID=28829 RepID=A0AAV6S9W4_SOLSE|nr:hypothetical protein JOB18_037945 [Solea senegalensis]